MIVERDEVRSRLLSSREAARLMGLSKDYMLPSNYNEAYHLDAASSGSWRAKSARLDRPARNGRYPCTTLRR